MAALLKTENVSVSHMQSRCTPLLKTENVSVSHMQ
jgi:hypothetical protein